MRFKPLPTQEKLQELFEYDDERGALIWKVSRGSQKAGVVAGYIKKNGRIYINVDRIKYLANRLMWMFHTGEDPGDLLVDHKNEDPSDNHIENLRLATDGQNHINVSKTKGYSLRKATGKYQAQIKMDGDSIHLGYFSRKEDARAAYVKKARELFGEFAPAC